MNWTMKAIARAHLLRELQNEKGDWLEKRVAYVTANGSIDIDNIMPTSIINHGHTIRARIIPSIQARAYRDAALMLMTDPSDKILANATRIQAT